MSDFNLSKEIEEIRKVHYDRNDLAAISMVEEKIKQAIKELKSKIFNEERKCSEQLPNAWYNGYSSACDWIRTELIKELFEESSEKEAKKNV